MSLADKQSDQENLLNKYPFSHKELDCDKFGNDEPPAEQLYKIILPHMAQYVIGLLKILLAGAPTSKPKTDSINILVEIMTTESMEMFLKMGCGTTDAHNLAAAAHQKVKT